MMTSGKACGRAESSSPTPECCMCGDQGLSFELFICKICHFRSQHRYCSSLYPKAETYKVCNWCLYQKNDSAEKTQNSSNSTSSHKNNDENKDRVMGKIKSKNDQIHRRGVRGQKSNLHLQESKPVKKHGPPERPLADGGRKGIGGSGLKDRLRRTKSDDITNSRAEQVVRRSKVRRYKLLDEVVSSQ